METGLAAPILDRKKDVDTDNIIGFIQKPSGMPDGVFRKLVSAEVHKPGGVIDVGTLQAAVDKAASEWVSSHKHEIDPNIMLAGAAAVASDVAKESFLQRLIKDDIVDAALDLTIDAIGSLAGFNCHDKHSRAIIRNTIKQAKADAATLYKDPALQKSAAEFIVSGASALANGDISKLQYHGKGMTGAINGLDPESRKQFDDLLKKGKMTGDISEAAGYLYDHDTTGKLHNMSREDFIRKAQHRFDRIHHHSYFDHMFDQSRHAPHAPSTTQTHSSAPVPTAAHHSHYDRIAMSPTLSTDAPKPAASKITPNNKYAGLATAPGMIGA